MWLVNCSTALCVCVFVCFLNVWAWQRPYNLLLCAHYHNVFYLAADLYGPPVRNHLRRSALSCRTTLPGYPSTHNPQSNDPSTHHILQALLALVRFKLPTVWLTDCLSWTGQVQFVSFVVGWQVACFIIHILIIFDSFSACTFSCLHLFRLA